MRCSGAWKEKLILEPRLWWKANHFGENEETSLGCRWASCVIVITTHEAVAEREAKYMPTDKSEGVIALGDKTLTHHITATQVHYDSRYDFYNVECRGKWTIDSETEYELTWTAIKGMRPRFGQNHDENTARSKLALDIHVSKLKMETNPVKAYIATTRTMQHCTGSDSGTFSIFWPRKLPILNVVDLDEIHMKKTAENHR